MGGPALFVGGGAALISISGEEGSGDGGGGGSWGRGGRSICSGGRGVT